MEANVDASEREDSGSGGLQRDFTREVKKCIAKLKHGKAAGADQILNLFIYEVRGRRNAYHGGYVL